MRPLERLHESEEGVPGRPVGAGRGHHVGAQLPDDPFGDSDCSTARDTAKGGPSSDRLEPGQTPLAVARWRARTRTHVVPVF
jgi:hypothetical protein